jgi:hypothetical protein
MQGKTVMSREPLYTVVSLALLVACMSFKGGRVLVLPALFLLLLVLIYWAAKPGPED